MDLSSYIVYGNECLVYYCDGKGVWNEVKMEEYGNPLLTLETNQQSEADGPSTIDEKWGIEEQINRWEKKVSQLNMENSRVGLSHRDKLEKLEDELKGEDDHRETHGSLATAQ